MKDHRIVGSNGARIPFTCENHGFKTDLRGGGPHPAPGSVFAKPLIRAQGYSLWLEHVVDKKTLQNDLYWFMWYDDVQGMPTIPLSGVFGKDELREMLSQLADFIP